MIKVKCPNAACGKVLTVKDEYAGKKGKCPDCGKELLIPKAGTSPPAAGSSPPKKEPKQPGPDVASKPPAKTPAPPKPTSPAAERKEDEENETEEEESRPARPSGPAAHPKVVPASVASRRPKKKTTRTRTRRRTTTMTMRRMTTTTRKTTNPRNFNAAYPRIQSVRSGPIRRGVNLIYLQMCCSLGAIGALLGGLLLAIVIGYAFEKPMRARSSGWRFRRAPVCWAWRELLRP